MWPELAADARLYSALRWPRRTSRVWHGLIWLRAPGLWVLALQRLMRYYTLLRARGGGWTVRTIAMRLLIALARRPIFILTKCDVAERSAIAPGVYLSDRGFLILGPHAIGSGTLIHERVTIGVRAGAKGRPDIGRNVWIGRDCVIYGQLSIGDGATVLPGSVVSIDVPAGAVVGGNPASILRRGFDNAPLRGTLSVDVDRAAIATP
jgi:serine acetyltransferase